MFYSGNQNSKTKKGAQQANLTPSFNSNVQSIIMPTIAASVDVRDWKTYKNHAFNFSFIYPPEWEFEEKISNGYLDEQLKNGTDIRFGPMDDKNHIGELVQPFINGRIIFHVYKTLTVTIENLVLAYPASSTVL